VVNLEDDPIINAIHKGIKRDIQITLDNNCLRATVILIYAGMDAMAFLDMPKGQTEVKRKDFIDWAERYIHFPCKEQLTGADLYGARCSMLHAYGAVSRMSNAGECRVIGYMDKSLPEIRYETDEALKHLVLVSIPALKDAFFKGIDKFLVDAFSDKKKAEIVEERLRTFVQQFPYKPGGK